jgi:hypothetical protein
MSKRLAFCALLASAILPLASVAACSADNAADDVPALRQIGSALSPLRAEC